jgi:hypothetical protein
MPIGMIDRIYFRAQNLALLATEFTGIGVTHDHASTDVIHMVIKILASNFTKEDLRP